MASKLVRIILLTAIAPASAVMAVELRMTGYEPNDPAVTLSAFGIGNAAEIVKGGISNAPFSLDGEHLLKLSWTEKTTRKVAVKHAWKKQTFDLSGFQRLLMDVYIPDSAKPSEVTVWDNELGNLNAVNELQTNQWITLEFDISKKQPACLKEITGVIFENIQTETGSVYIDNLRLLNFTPEILEIIGEEKRIDITWKPLPVKNLQGYIIYRAAKGTNEFTKINQSVYEPTVFSDFIGRNNVGYTYQISSIVDRKESPKSGAVSADSKALTDEQLLTSVQRACFRFFWDLSHPVSGLSREGYPHHKDICTIGGTGMGIFNIIVGAERNFVRRDDSARHLLKMLAFLEDKAVRYHGVWPHWLDGLTGQTVPFSLQDDGGDIVETAFLIEGILSARQYFDRDNIIENEIRMRAKRLWEQVEWDWYRQRPDSPHIYWHWSPNHGWAKNHPVRGFNECMIVYLLAVASPTHPLPASCYHEGWAQGGNNVYRNNKNFYGNTLYVGPDYGGPLFFTHYSYLGFDPRNKQDAYCNYFENNRNIALIHRAYCIENPYNFAGYGKNCWGLTASTTPPKTDNKTRDWRYSAHRPYYRDNGTIAPTAAISSFPYTPEESMAALKHFYHEHGEKLWGAFGFYDAFNLSKDWYSGTWLAIDQGTIAPMIENHRSQLCWGLFMKNPEILPALDAIGFKEDTPQKKDNKNTKER